VKNKTAGRSEEKKPTTPKTRKNSQGIVWNTVNS